MPCGSASGALVPAALVPAALVPPGPPSAPGPGHVVRQLEEEGGEEADEDDGGGEVHRLGQRPGERLGDEGRHLPAAHPLGHALRLDAAGAAEAFTAARDRLEKALPPGFALTATLAPPPAGPEGGPIEFTATTTGQGIRLRGVIADERMGSALESLATARFGPPDAILRGTYSSRHAGSY